LKLVLVLLVEQEGEVGGQLVGSWAVGVPLDLQAVHLSFVPADGELLAGLVFAPEVVVGMDWDGEGLRGLRGSDQGALVEVD
jgi:hypothetical protein